MDWYSGTPELKIVGSRKISDKVLVRAKFADDSKEWFGIARCKENRVDQSLYWDIDNYRNLGEESDILAWTKLDVTDKIYCTGTHENAYETYQTRQIVDTLDLPEILISQHWYPLEPLLDIFLNAAMNEALGICKFEDGDDVFNTHYKIFEATYGQQRARELAIFCIKQHLDPVVHKKYFETFDIKT